MRVWLCRKGTGPARGLCVPQTTEAVAVNDERMEWDPEDRVEWPDPELPVDDEAFAAAIARGREYDEAA